MGASDKEIAETLAEVEREESGRDPHFRARRAGVPPLYLGVGWDDIEVDGRRDAIEAARKWATAITTDPGKTDGQAIPRGLYLWSSGDADEDLTGFGTGKTRIAAAAAQQVIHSRRRQVRWLDIVRAMTDLNFPYSSPIYVAAYKRLRTPSSNEMIVLDDIDKQPSKDRNIQPIFALINDCVNGEIPLLITANRCPDDLQADWGERFGHAAASRIIGHCLDVEVRGRDRRLDPAVS